MFADSLEAARKYGNEALAMAVTSGDSNAISNTCQNLSVIQRKEENYRLTRKTLCLPKDH